MSLRQFPGGRGQKAKQGKSGSASNKHVEKFGGRRIGSERAGRSKALPLIPYVSCVVSRMRSHRSNEGLKSRLPESSIAASPLPPPTRHPMVRSHGTPTAKSVPTWRRTTSSMLRLPLWTPSAPASGWPWTGWTCPMSRPPPLIRQCAADRGLAGCRLDVLPPARGQRADARTLVVMRRVPGFVDNPPRGHVP